jgi:hypothetical protein
LRRVVEVLEPWCWIRNVSETDAMMSMRAFCGRSRIMRARRCILVAGVAAGALDLADLRGELVGVLKRGALGAPEAVVGVGGVADGASLDAAGALPSSWSSIRVELGVAC